MSRSDAERIDDILAACEELADIVNQGRAAFDSRSVLRRAAERLLDVIGEAAGAISPEVAEANPSLPLAKAKAMRNILSHEYWLSNPDIVWGTIERDIPAFASTLQDIRDAMTPPGGITSFQQLGSSRPAQADSATSQRQTSTRRQQTRRPRCGKWMPRAKRRCTRPKRHRGGCR